MSKSCPSDSKRASPQLYSTNTYHPPLQIRRVMSSVTRHDKVVSAPAIATGNGLVRIGILIGLDFNKVMALIFPLQLLNAVTVKIPSVKLSVNRIGIVQEGPSLENKVSVNFLEHPCCAYQFLSLKTPRYIHRHS